MKCFLHTLLSLFCLISTLNLPTIYASSTYYVSSSGSNTGNGSQNAPFKTVNYAYNIAKDHDTIIILDEGIILDEHNNDAPFIIEKELTFLGSSADASIIVRAGGILLGSNVTFENVSIGTAGFLRPGIAANGHHLTLNNISQNNTLRPLQIYGGTFADYQDSTYGQDVRGDLSIIEINDGSYDAIYAGSVNTTNTIPVQIKASKTSSLSFHAIYVASVSKDPADTSMAGQIPSIDHTILTNEVDIHLNNVTTRTIAGIHEDNQISLSITSKNLYTPEIQYIDDLRIHSSVVAPKGSLAHTNITLNGSNVKKAVLDCSYLTSNQLKSLDANEYGMFILNKELPFTIDTLLSTYPIEIRTAGGMSYASEELCGYSGYIDYDTTLINVNNTSLGSFEIMNPYPTQEDLCLIQEDKSWVTYDGSNGLPIRIINFETFDQTTSSEMINQAFDGYGGFDLNLLVQYHPDEYLTDLSFTPITYQITYDGDETITYPQQTATLNEDGYYVCNYQANDQTLMKLEAFGNSINICKDEIDIPIGTYKINISMQTTNGIESKTITLKVQETLDIPDIQTLEVSTDKFEYYYGSTMKVTVHLSSNTSQTKGNLYIYNNNQFIKSFNVEDGTTIDLQMNSSNQFNEGNYNLNFVYQNYNYDLYEDQNAYSVTLFDEMEINILPSYLQAPQNLKAIQKNYKTIQLSWNPVENASYYDIYKKEASGDKKIDTTTTHSIEISKLTTGKTYEYYVVARNDEYGAYAMSESIAFATKLTGTLQLEIENVSSTKFKLSWNKIDGATRYIIYREGCGASYKKILTLGGHVLSYTTSSLAAGQYNFIVKPARYDSVDRIMGKPSNEVSATSVFETPVLSATKKDSKCLLEWNTIEGIQYYQIYRSTSKNGTYRRIKTIKETSYKTTYKSKYHYKVRGYRTYQGDKIYSSFSNKVNI